MRNHSQNSIWKSAFLLGILLATTRFTSGQALVTAQRGTEIAPFAQTTLVGPDWGQTNNLGYTTGVDFTRFIPSSLFQPSLEFRYTRANGRTVNERSYAGGFKVQTTVHGVRPYATFLVGHGNIDFNYANNGYNSDNALVLSYGGGAEFNITRQWAARFDFTSQHWNCGPYTLTPMTLGAGIAYRLPFLNRRVR